MASGKTEAAICVQDVDVQCVLQFTLIHAAGCALHRHTSRVIHRLESSLSKSKGSTTTSRQQSDASPRPGQGPNQKGKTTVVKNNRGRRGGTRPGWAGRSSLDHRLECSPAETRVPAARYPDTGKSFPSPLSQPRRKPPPRQATEASERPGERPLRTPSRSTAQRYTRGIIR